MRATAQDRDAARLMGIDVDRAISFAFGLGGALAGIGGFVYFAYFTQARFDLGFRLGLFAFTAAVLGGIGNMAGAALGGYLIGLIENFNNGLSWHTPGPDWTESIVFILLILILVFRPQGLLGEAALDARMMESLTARIPTRPALRRAARAARRSTRGSTTTSCRRTRSGFRTRRPPS